MYEIRNPKYNDPIKYDNPNDTSVNFINKEILKNIANYLKIKGNDSSNPLDEAKELIKCFKSSNKLVKYIYLDTLKCEDDFNMDDLLYFTENFESENPIFNFLENLTRDVHIEEVQSFSDLYIKHNNTERLTFNFTRYDETFNNIDGTNLITSDGNIIYIDESIIKHLHLSLIEIRKDLQKSVILSREKGLL